MKRGTGLLSEGVYRSVKLHKAFQTVCTAVLILFGIRFLYLFLMFYPQIV